MENSQAEKKGIEVLGESLIGTDRPLIVTSGVALISPSRFVTEDSIRDETLPFPRDPETVAF